MKNTQKYLKKITMWLLFIGITAMLVGSLSVVVYAVVKLFELEILKSILGFIIAFAFGIIFNILKDVSEYLQNKWKGEL